MPQSSKNLKSLNSELKKLQSDLTLAKKAVGIDDNLTIDVTTNQARFERVNVLGGADRGVGRFYMEMSVTATKSDVYIPLSMASGKKPAGFIYQIEGTGEGTIMTANVKSRGTGVTEVTWGTLLYCKIPAGKTAVLILQTAIRGNIGKTYKIVITRINYKLKMIDVRYIPLNKEIASESVQFS